MKVGIFVTNQNPLGTDMVSALDDQFVMTRLARDRGWDAVGTGQPVAPRRIPKYKGHGDIYGDFIHCVQTREKPFRDIERAANTAVVSHLGNIAYQLKRSLKWDAARQEFPGDEEANRFVDRARREPWQL